MKTEDLSLRVGVVLLVGVGLLAGAVEMASATVSPVQSPARPFGLEIAGPVQLAGSDAKAAQFQSDILPAVQSLVNSRLSEKQALSNASSLAVDPSLLRLATEADVRAYFVGEGAVYHNTLGFNTQGSGTTGGDPKLIFPDASTAPAYNNPNPYPGGRTGNDPLLPGDFVDLGRVSAGAKLDFFLIANGVYGGRNVYSTDASANQDGIAHAVSLHTMNDSPYLVLGFEDLRGGDWDYNDVVLAVDMGKTNANALVSNPEPSTFVLLASFLGLAFFLTRRTRKEWTT